MSPLPSFALESTRILLLIMILVICFSSSCSLFGGVSDEGRVTVVIENTDGSYDSFNVELNEVENKSEGVRGILDHLAKGKEKLYVGLVDGGYGAYVSAIGKIAESPTQGSYVMVYTSVNTDGYEGGPTVDYNGITLYQAGVGISSMTVTDGTVILFRLEVYEY